MIPGVEGLAWVMEPLAKQLHRPVVCLQLPLDAKSHKIPDLTNILTEVCRIFSINYNIFKVVAIVVTK